MFFYALFETVFYTVVRFDVIIVTDRYIGNNEIQFYVTEVYRLAGEVTRSMNITDIRVRKVSSENSKMRAIVSVTFDDCFVVHDIKVIEGQDKLFIAMPSRKTADGEFKDIAHPINSSTREELEKAILAKYDEVLSEEPEETKED